MEMMRRITTVACCLVVLGIGLANGQVLIPAIFCFGDSTSDTGTNTYLPNPAFLANFTPYGETFFHKPTGRFSNGRLVIDYLATLLGLPFLSPYLQPGVTNYNQGINFASAGSGFLDRTKAGGVVSANQQLQQFQTVKMSLQNKDGNLQTALLLSEALFYISTGSNDIVYTYLGNQTLQQTITPQQFADILIHQLSSTVTNLYNAGGRRFFLNGLGPLGCVPALRGLTGDGSCLAVANQIATAFNSELPSLQFNLTVGLPGSLILYTNIYDVLYGFIFNGSAQGFTMGSTACCGEGAFNGAVQCGTSPTTTLCSNTTLDQYVFWDYFHPTEKTYRLLLLSALTGSLSTLL